MGGEAAQDDLCKVRQAGRKGQACKGRFALSAMVTSGGDVDGAKAVEPGTRKEGLEEDEGRLFGAKRKDQPGSSDR